MSFAVGLLKGDRRRRNTRDRSDERHDRRKVATGLSRKDRAERLRLVGLGSLVQVERHLPATVGHLFWRVQRERNVESGKIHAILLSARDVPREEGLARVIRCRAQHDALTRDCAVARLEVVTLDRVTHLANSPLVSATAPARIVWRRRAAI